MRAQRTVPSNGLRRWGPGTSYPGLLGPQHGTEMEREVNMANRQSISGPGIPEHPQPFPPAVRVGNMIFSSAIGGQNSESGKTPDDPQAQIAQAFVNMRNIVEQGGGGTWNIGKVVVYLKNRKDRDIVNVEWKKMFPDEADCPVRHTITNELPGKRIIQMEFIAVV